MGFFSTLATIYVLGAFAFQTLALGFIGFDSQCSSKRARWLLLTLFTGPVGLLAYFLKGRH